MSKIHTRLLSVTTPNPLDELPNPLEAVQKCNRGLVLSTLLLLGKLRRGAGRGRHGHKTAAVAAPAGCSISPHAMADVAERFVGWERGPWND
jgi:hypothetical protein